MAKKSRLQREGDKWLKQSMTKKELKKHYQKDRTRVLFDTSTKTFKSKRDYDRKAEKRKAREAKRGAEEQGLTEARSCAILTVVKKEREDKDYGKTCNSKRLNCTA